MIKYEHIFQDADVQVIAEICLEKGISLQAFDLWCRCAAFSYFTNPSDKSYVLNEGLYEEAVCSKEERMEHNPELAKYGLVRFSEEYNRYVICRPSKIIARWELAVLKKQAEEHAAGFKAVVRQADELKAQLRELATA